MGILLTIIEVEKLFVVFFLLFVVSLTWFFFYFVGRLSEGFNVIVSIILEFFRCGFSLLSHFHSVEKLN